MKLRAAAAALALLAAGCSTTDGLLDGGSQIEYKSAGKLPPLDVPPDLTAPAREGRYQAPDAARGAATLSDYQAGRTQQAPADTGGTTVLPAPKGVRVVRAGSQRWLVVDQPPDKLWPVVKSFWQENGLLIAREIPEAGVMETDWAENRAKIPDSWVRRTLGSLIEPLHSSGERDKYRVRMEPAPGGGTEIYISHRGLEEVYVGEGAVERTQTAWQPRPSDPGLEAEFLRRLMVRLGTPEGEARARIVGAQPAAQRATLRKVDGAELLEVLEPFDRAWRRVGLALDRVGFTVEDRDRQKGVYFVRYADPLAEVKQAPGLLGRLAFWRDDDPKVKAEQYRVAVSPDQEVSRVQVFDKNGAAGKSPTASRILALLHEQLK